MVLPTTIGNVILSAAKDLLRRGMGILPLRSSGLWLTLLRMT
jgi:hypothetical protein